MARISSARRIPSGPSRAPQRRGFYQRSAIQGRKRLGEVAHGDYFHPRRGLAGRVGGGHDGAGEAVLGGLAQALLTARHRADLTGQADLAEGKHKEAAREVTVTCATDGNHGRSVAWGAQRFGCRSIFLTNEQNDDDLARCQPDHVVNQLGEVLDLLRENRP